MSFDMFAVEQNPIDLEDLVSRILVCVTPLLSEHKMFQRVACKTFDGKFDIALDCYTEHEVHVTFVFGRDPKAVSIAQLQNNWKRLLAFLKPFETKITELINTTHKCTVKHPLRIIHDQGGNEEITISTCLLLGGYRCPAISRETRELVS